MAVRSSSRFLILALAGLVVSLAAYGAKAPTAAQAPQVAPEAVPQAGTPQATSAEEPKPSSAPVAAPSATPAPKAAPQAEFIPITRVVGEIANHHVTSREARMNRAIEAIIGKALGETQQLGSAESLQLLTGQEKAFHLDVVRVLDEWAIYLEAKSLSSSGAARTDLSRVLAAIEEHWGPKPEWQAIEPSAEELKAIAERKLIARDFERLKSDSSLVPVTENDALQYFRRNRLRFGGVPFASVKENIRVFLIKQQTDKRLEEWKEVLRRKYKVRNFLSG